MLAALALVLGLTATSPPDAVQEAELVPAEGTEFLFEDRTLTGSIRLVLVDGGVAVVETLSLEDYLRGIREVPFSWPHEALAAQAVAARTYLARTLLGEPSANARRYGFDICATDQCQVYRGRPDGPDVHRWEQAILATAGELVLHEGRPALTLYSSSAGERTRPIQDVWGSAPLPYLQGVASPEAGVTPFESWLVRIPAYALAAIMREAGYAVDSVTNVTLESPPEGSGPSTVVVTGYGGSVRLGVTTLRSVLNRVGPGLYPGLLPAERADGLTLPQALPSYTFDVEFDPPGVVTRMTDLLPPDDRPNDGELRLRGQGWGHGVGMSQWGAKAMADAGHSYADILRHYYGGLGPVAAPGQVPREVRVGLGWGARSVELSATGPYELILNGVAAGTLDAGALGARATPRGLMLGSPRDRAWFAE